MITGESKYSPIEKLVSRGEGYRVVRNGHRNVVLLNDDAPRPIADAQSQAATIEAEVVLASGIARQPDPAKKSNTISFSCGAPSWINL